MLISLCLLIGLGPLFTGCASIIDGTKQKVSFSSSPSNAEVVVDGEGLGKTPLTKALSRKHEHNVLINLKGYQPYEVKLVHQTNGWVWGNLLFGGIIGLIIDASNGAIYELTPAQINADLKARGLSSTNLVDKTLYVTVTLHPDSSWKKIGSLQSL